VDVIIMFHNVLKIMTFYSIQLVLAKPNSMTW